MKNCSLSDVLAIGVIHDCCVVLPTFEHSFHYWPQVGEMFADRQPVNRTRTSVFLRKSLTIVRLWVPTMERTMPMDYEHDFVRRAIYLNLYGLYPAKKVIWEWA